MMHYQKKNTKHEWISNVKITKQQLKQIIKEEVGETLGDQASQKLSQAGIAKEPEQVRKELMRMILGLDTGDEEDAEALSFMAAYLKDASAANVRQGLGLEEGFENITPENIQIAVEAFKQVAMNLAPAVVLPALMMAYKELKMSKKE